VPEELGLEQRLRERGAVDRDEGPLGPRAAVVNGAGDQLLAGPGLAQEQDGRLGRGRPGRQAVDLHHLGREPDDVLEAVPVAERLPEAHVLLGQPSLLELYEGTAHGGGGLLYPNPRLDPETSDNYELGARLEAGPLRLDAAFFYTRARDYVTTVACGGDAPCPPQAIPEVDRVYANVNGARTRGLEVSATLGLGSLPAELFAETTWLHREFEYAELTTSDTGLPGFWGRGGLRFGRTRSSERRYFAELSVRAASDADEEVSPSETLHYRGWAVLNARAGIELGTRVPVALTLEAGNLLDKAYRSSQETLYQPGRHVLAKIVTSF